jgi:valyl-tRNA synthetase
MAEQLSKVYDPKAVEEQINQLWQSGSYFHAEPSRSGRQRPPFTIVIPPPNVTAALHLGHALNNTLQDVLIRFRRMQQHETLWMPGTDHAGIATQTVVEKRILSEEGKRRTDFARDEFVKRIQAWKDEYEATILGQLKAMGCSCDWQRTRFTMDEVCAKAVRATFFKLFQDGLIYRGKRLVNWDPATQTVLADDEVEHETVQGHFWYLKYPLVETVTIPRGEGVPPLHPESVPLSAQPDEIDRRKGHCLPHWIQSGGIYAVTFRLADSLPSHVLDAWRREREDILLRAQQQGRALTDHEGMELDRLYSTRIETFLDSGQGACHLAKPEIASLVRDALRHFDGQRYDLIAWCIMPNHVHVIVRPFEGYDLAGILHSWKSFTAKEANKQLGKTGAFWQEESYDHLIRGEKDFNHHLTYLMGNPEKAGLEGWTWVGVKSQSPQEEHRQDARATQGRDALATMTYVTVATTRPETMLGDTAVAMNPSDPRAKDLVGKQIRLPIVGRLIPIIADEHVVLPNPESEDEKAKFSTGFLKVTPAHDPDDWAIGQRHNLPVINIMAPDGSISDKYGWQDATEPEARNLLGMDRFEAREAIVEWFRQENLLEDVRDYSHEVGHSYRSHVPIEPYLSDQWYVNVRKPIEELAEKFGSGRIEGTEIPVNSLAGLALKPLLDGRLRFIPERYARTYQTWLENLRDWPISRQLWWGHQIPIWKGLANEGFLAPFFSRKKTASGDSYSEPVEVSINGEYPVEVQYRREDDKDYAYVCVPPGSLEAERLLEKAGYQRDSDVLDTWFSSALWPFSTLGWPEESPTLKTFYPGNVLCTAREIITLWVSRMVMMGQYCAGDIPFRDVYIHAMIQDGEGRKMSKSLGNGIDPLIVIDSHGADAMRFTLATMTTDTQDIRMPVASMTLPDGRTVNTSPKFDVGRNFCNKLWNASRFAMMNLEGVDPAGFDASRLDVTDRWILSRLATTRDEVTAAIESFKFSEPMNLLYRFFWNDLCDWYLEWAKYRVRDEAAKGVAQNVLAFVLDQTLRLLHPFIPFITEGIYQNLRELTPIRELRGLAPGDNAEALAVAPWPQSMESLKDGVAEAQIQVVQDVVRAIRDLRSKYNIAPSVKLQASASAPQVVAEVLETGSPLVCQLAGLASFQAAEGLAKPNNAATAIVEGTNVYVHDVIDPEAERARLVKQKQEIEQAKKGVESKLGNENFVARAKPEVVAQAREKLQQLQDQLQAVEKHLAELDG